MSGESPKVFVNYGSEDKARFVRDFCARLRNNGVDAWYDRWEITLGDSLIQKIFEEGIREFQDKTEQYTKELEENMIGARRDGFNEKEDLKNKGLEEEKSMLQEATASAGEKIEKAKQDIESTMAGVRQSLEKEVANFSKEFAEKILGRSV